ncbi:ArsR/SmtB family transcription factor [Aurantimonas marianensis]|uniref:Metalloregulator ArsR/SmtB family transcription factor n=1 Tax=Aurantimonas marianensis TaxID=2920428 RepID=A0A9X2H7D4_9HYPH|nr:metalloregulator ArsR/SmtB family transcription factor [Aurantimonas marianensis]MCP3055581.1 metalloregulator ArsR/SmtB family transcription factor [Aurantimonas marianensis]
MSKVVKSNMLELDARAASVAAILALMGNAHRLRILCRLAEDEASVGALVCEVGLSQSALSQHLAKLRAGGLVATRRDAQTIFYSLASQEIRAIMASLYDVFCRHGRRDTES